jgi:hypothetical protein
MAVRSRAQDGLGLVSIGGDTYGLVIIGRASDRDECNREHLSQLAWENHIRIRSYDWLARQAREGIEARNEFGDVQCEECQGARNS